VEFGASWVQVINTAELAPDGQEAQASAAGATLTVPARTTIVLRAGD